MRETPEARDDVVMQACVARVVVKQGTLPGCNRRGERLEQLQRALLHGHRLRMLEWHVEEHPFDRVQLFIVATRDGALGYCKRPLILGKSGGCATKNVAAELVEQDYQRELSFG